MTRAEILALPDDELVRRVAEKVKPPNVRLYTIEADGYYVDCGGWGHAWRPLESWDDCMMVVDAMRANGWHVVLDTYMELVRFFQETDHDDNGGGCVELDCKRGDATSQRRGVLVAAILSLEGV